MKSIKHNGGIHMVRFEKGEEVYAGIMEYAKKEGIQNATASAIGALSGAELGFYHLDTKTYSWRAFEDMHELVGGTGNITLVDGVPFLHMHVVLGDKDFRAYGGHLRKGFAGATCEVVLVEITGEMPVSRVMDEDVGLTLWEL